MFVKYFNHWTNFSSRLLPRIDTHVYLFSLQGFEVLKNVIHEHVCKYKENKQNTNKIIVRRILSFFSFDAH